MTGQQIYSGVTGNKTGHQPPDYTSYDVGHRHTFNYNQKYTPTTQHQHQIPSNQGLHTPEENQYAYTYRKQHGHPPESEIIRETGQSRNREDHHEEHVYESPVFSRKDLSSSCGPQYFELNPEEMTSRSVHITG